MEQQFSYNFNALQVQVGEFSMTCNGRAKFTNLPPLGRVKFDSVIITDWQEPFDSQFSFTQADIDCHSLRILDHLNENKDLCESLFIQSTPTK